MCSIAGSTKREDVETMLEVLKHRAPDDSGIVSDEKFSVGMGRLKIIDLKSDGLCPYTEDGLTLAFNGEIYNYKELKRQLENSGWVFRTKSDTEVLLKAYRQWGIRCLDRLNGMFAFAIYDGQKIFLARDIAGEKPLYFRKTDFAFASEAKALNWDCEELPPAHYALYDFKELKIARYWELKQREVRSDTAEEELEHLLADSIRLRTQADVPYGLYLSGGIDSSLINTFHDFKHTFTYEDGDYQEQFNEQFPRILWHLDYPVQSFSPFGLWQLARMASDKVKVVLSGEGADELFGGYVRYVRTSLNAEARVMFPSYQGLFQSEYKDVHEQGWAEFNGNMQELLRMGDRMASAFGIENRCPFLDKRIIEFAYSLPLELKIKGFETKRILRRILERRNPQYKHIEKAGLFCDVNKWIGSQDGFGKKDYLDYQQKIWQNFQS